MMKLNKGYSMIVLVITIAVILILATTAISMMQASRENSKMTDFIYDVRTVEESVKSYYTRTGTLPVASFDKIDINDPDVFDEEIRKKLLTQLSTYDNENYYDIDLTQLGTIALRDTERGYFVNEGSLKVYVKNGVEYYSEDSKQKEIYYTLTSTLINGLDIYSSPEEEVLVVGNPITWSNVASLRVILPRRSLQESGDNSWEDWTFKWDYGPKTEEELEKIPSSNASKNFKYGDILEVKSNGVYSVYVRNPEGETTVVNVNVTKIDDIPPKYKFINTTTPVELQLLDNETGIKSISYKTLANYNTNVETAKEAPEEEEIKGRSEADYYLLDGVGKDVIYDMQADFNYFKVQRSTILEAINLGLDNLNDNFIAWSQSDVDDVITESEYQTENERIQELISDLVNQLTQLQDEYPYFEAFILNRNPNEIRNLAERITLPISYPGFPDKISKLSDTISKYYNKIEAGNREDMRLVLYVEDYAGNGTVVGVNDEVLLEMVANAYNIDLSISDEP